VAEAFVIQYSLFGSNKSVSFIGKSFCQYSELLQVFIKYSNHTSLQALIKLIVHITLKSNKSFIHLQSLHM
jgi:hypothetical protein